MARRLFNLAAAVSLLVLILAAGLWVRSRYVRDWVVWSRAGGDYHSIESAYGQVTWERYAPCPYDLELQWAARRHPEGHHAYFVEHVLARDGREWVEPLYEDGQIVRAGPSLFPYLIQIMRGQQPSFEGSRVVVPHRNIAAPAAVLPLAWLCLFARRAILARRLSRVGRCAACGYDLRATLDQCPECGAVPGAAR